MSHRGETLELVWLSEMSEIAVKKNLKSKVHLLHSWEVWCQRAININISIQHLEYIMVRTTTVRHLLQQKRENDSS